MSDKWRIERNSDLSITVQKVGIGGYAALESGPSGIAESFLFHLANDLLSERNASQPVATSTRLPTEADADPWGEVLAWNTYGMYWALLKFKDVTNQGFWSFWQTTNLKRPPAPGEVG